MDLCPDPGQVPSSSDDPFFDAVPPDLGQSPVIPPETSETSVSNPTEARNSGRFQAIPPEIGESSLSDPPKTHLLPPPTPVHPPSALRRRRPTTKQITRRRVSFDLDSSGIVSTEESRRESLPKDHESDDSASVLTSDLPGSEGERLAEAAVDSSEATSVHNRGEDGDAESMPSGGVLEFAAGLAIKAVIFQINLLLSCFTFPFWLLHLAFLIVVDPFGTSKRLIHGLKVRFWRMTKCLLDKISPSVYERLNQQGMGKYAVRIACGVFWSFIVCLMLVMLLIFAFVAGSLLLERIVSKPVQVTQELNFDYTKASPDAFLALGSCGRGGFGTAEEIWRLVPPNHKLQVTISLNLPESDYNRILGIFQVRVEFLSADGKLLSSSSQPCMLRFKSSHIRLIETFLKSISLLSGYSSESQVIKVKMKGFTEGTEPTTCLRVVLEQRAEYRPGAGIPEIYSASLKLESELPLLKKLIWNWRRTLFIWLSAVIFIFGFLIVLVCLGPAIVPRGRP